MEAHELADLLEARSRANQRYVEFLRVPSLSAGIYELPKDGKDLQTPHDEDELYHVVQGRATIRVGQEDQEVRPGTLIFVPARVEHRFHRIRQAFSLVVFFAPAEGSKARRIRHSR